MFLTHAVRPVMMIIQITGHNRARQRDKWARLLEELAALQDEVEFPVSSTTTTFLSVVDLAVVCIT